ncbi:hypothetical protein BD310DRAFT_914919 [Dichomitus squalens]|uniref:Uncharacterized protein n=1 Tax=Dichomitus squalens TaxID=114155 RepID=A0A4Q9QAH3_9APHY|nr:hypothetical protein BD310DRAFT_914919 [Dichomitus squalens]
MRCQKVSSSLCCVASELYPREALAASRAASRTAYERACSSSWDSSQRVTIAM